MIVETQKSLEYQQQLYAQRPLCRPIGNAKVWWRYAYTLVAGKLPDASNKVGIVCMSVLCVCMSVLCVCVFTYTLFLSLYTIAISI